MAGAIHGVRVTETAHDIGTRPHRTGDNPELPYRCRDCAFTRDEEPFATMILFGDVVAVAPNNRLRDEWTPKRIRHIFQKESKHYLPIQSSEVLRPHQVMPIGVHLWRAGEKDGEILVRKLGVVEQ